MSNPVSHHQKGGEYARKKCDAMFKHSRAEDLINSFPTFKFEELVLGKFLGKGGFGTVTEIRAFNIAGHKPIKNTRKDPEQTAEDNVENRAFIAEHCVRNGGKARYAVKKLSPEVVKDAGTFIQGITDMAIETRFLCSIEHPNIIKMRAISSGDRFGQDYFIVMDRLYEILDKRIAKWGKSQKKMSGFLGKMADKTGEKANTFLEDRLVAAFDLSAAILYLHERKILYRDIKPENIGFDVRDDVKLFDFGLAKEITSDVKSAGGGLYLLTGQTGSMRYMAPEVANSKPYNDKCDVYSMCILIWQMLSCKDPYEMYTPKSLREKVYNGVNKRPPILETWRPALKQLLQRGWTADISQRLTMSSVSTILKKEIAALRGGSETGLEHYRRRSTFVFRGARSKAAAPRARPVRTDSAKAC